MKQMAIALFLMLVLTTAMMPPYANAVGEIGGKTQGSWAFVQDEEFGPCLLNVDTGERLLKAFGCDADGAFVEMDLREYLQIKNAASIKGADTIYEGGNRDGLNSVFSYSGTYSYRETHSYIGTGTPVKVSGDLRGPGQISLFNTVTISHFFGGEISLNMQEKLAVQTGASFSWNTTLTSESMNGYEFSVPSNRVGYIQFTPYLHVTEGDLYYIQITPAGTYENFVGTAWGASPVRTGNGFADGCYELILR